MRMGAGVFLLALGAILKYATNLHVSGVELDTIGVILMLVGAFWLVMMFSLYNSRRRSTVVTQRRTPDPLSTEDERIVEERRTYEAPVESYEEDRY